MWFRASPHNTAFTSMALGSGMAAVSGTCDGLESGVGGDIDGVCPAHPGSAAFALSDIDRVAVRRGPQGSLFGKNTAAGAIAVISRAPILDRQSDVEVPVGENSDKGDLVSSKPEGAV